MRTTIVTGVAAGGLALLTACGAPSSETDRPNTPILAQDDPQRDGRILYQEALELGIDPAVHLQNRLRDHARAINRAKLLVRAETIKAARIDTPLNQDLLAALNEGLTAMVEHAGNADRLAEPIFADPDGLRYRVLGNRIAFHTGEIAANRDVETHRLALEDMGAGAFSGFLQAVFLLFDNHAFLTDPPWRPDPETVAAMIERQMDR